jgi:hypothetical protein
MNRNDSSSLNRLVTNLDLNPSWTYFAASATSAETTGITVATSEGYYFNKSDLVKVPSTGEIMLILNSSASGLTAVRGLNEP